MIFYARLPSSFCFGKGFLERYLNARKAPITLKITFRARSADQAIVSASKDLPRKLGAKTVSMVKATMDSPSPLRPAPVSNRVCDFEDFSYFEPIISARSKTRPENIVEGRR